MVNMWWYGALSITLEVEGRSLTTLNANADGHHDYYKCKRLEANGIRKRCRKAEVISLCFPSRSISGTIHLRCLPPSKYLQSQV